MKEQILKLCSEIKIEEAIYKLGELNKRLNN